MSVHGKQLPPVLTEEWPFDLEGDAYGVSKAEGNDGVRARSRARRGGGRAAPHADLRPRGPLWGCGTSTACGASRWRSSTAGNGIANLVYVDDVIDAMWPRPSGRPLRARRSFERRSAGVVAGVPRRLRPYVRQAAAAVGAALVRQAETQVMASTASWRSARADSPASTLLSCRCGRCEHREGAAPARLDPAHSLAAGMAEYEAWLRREGYLRASPPPDQGVGADGP